MRRTVIEVLLFVSLVSTVVAGSVQMMSTERVLSGVCTFNSSGQCVSTTCLQCSVSGSKCVCVS